MKDMNFYNSQRESVIKKIDHLAEKLTCLQYSAHSLIVEIQSIQRSAPDRSFAYGKKSDQLIASISSTKDYWHRYLAQDADVWSLREKQLTWGSCCRLVATSLSTLEAVLEASSNFTNDASQLLYLNHVDPDYSELIDLRCETLYRERVWKEFYPLSNRLLVECYCLAGV